MISRFTICHVLDKSGVNSLYSLYVSTTNLISKDFPVYWRSLMCGQSRVEALFARMRLRLNFISDDICLRTVMCGQKLENAL